MKKFKRWLIGIIVVILVALIGGQLYLKSAAHAPTPSAATAQKQATTKNGVLYFGKRSAKLTIVMYPGALVDPGAYSIWASQVAKAGYRVAIVSFPDDLAVLKPNAASQVVKSGHPYVIGGHSLGGVMASRYAAKHKQNLKGVFFLASYPDAKGKLTGNLPVLSLTASRDGVLNFDAWRKAKKNLPTATTTYKQLQGGNHAGFGSYGKQSGDRTATTTNQVQQQWIATQLTTWLDTLQ
ncbi:alpha/beta fold hydrolase [Lacticaseibacillus porcinae]|uniref:alpha/beta fold hydrolase n=1 Tax=Lacticaseibacillus porcinae TaxID=1123687 RepID=UPI000F79A700|nr:alpha/beta fold hydrolase [Lacticaseibacillus porcinae]